MKVTTIKDENEFERMILTDPDFKGQVGSETTQVVFDFELVLDKSLSSGTVPIRYRYFNCVFKKNLTLSTSASSIKFERCKFEGEFLCENTSYKVKVRLLNCDFLGKTNFKNSKFHDLADFWRSTFNQEVIFYKTDFLGTVVFSATTFEKNVLFTYTLIEKLILFRGTVIKQGIDLSTSIISGSVGTFGLSLWDFKAKKGRLTDQEFETAVSKSGEIPIKNKRETFRILKQANIQQNNVIESIPYQALEKKTLLTELLDSLQKPENFKEWWRSFWDLIVLGLNWMSNSFGKAPMQGVIFTLCCGILFFYLNITQTNKYEMALHLSWDVFVDEIPNYLKFILPTHGLDYLGSEFYEKYSVSNWYYVWDIVGRIFVGFGIYQTIQAFRKFR
ncbi:pentapeptide repeat-containing protein [Algoriphagus marincola]|uniref:pentapeptide repeat-containing protein n=1 Tax=Algoriphagus marincola TaxID=264027 RepID=UPI00047AD030|nr:pentapeptide repeat-containing protein [Algoriphagus marincola]